MKLAFSGKARYPDMTDGYNLYVKRSRSRECVDRKMYNRVIRDYCRSLTDRLLEEGMADIPELGSVAAANIRRKAQYRGKKFIGYGKMDCEKGHLDGELHAFGLVFLPNRNKSSNVRSFGVVANRQLFKKMKALFLSDDCPWRPMEYDDEII